MSRSRRPSAAALLTSVSALTLAGILVARPDPALAQCAPDPVAAGGTVECIGTDDDGFRTASSPVTVNVRSGAVVRTASGTALPTIRLEGAGSITNGGRIESATGSLAVDGGIGTSLVNRGTIDVRAGNGVAIRQGLFQNTEDAVITVVGRPNTGTVGDQSSGNGSVINFQRALIDVRGDNTVIGIQGIGNANPIVNRGRIEVAATGAGSATGILSSLETATGQLLENDNAGAIVVNGGFGAGMSIQNVQAGATSTLRNRGTIDVTTIFAGGGFGMLALDDDIAQSSGTILTRSENGIGIGLAGQDVQGFNSGTISAEGALGTGASLLVGSRGAFFSNLGAGLIEATGSGLGTASGLTFQGGEIGLSLPGASGVFVGGTEGQVDNTATIRATGAGSAGIQVGGESNIDFGFLGTRPAFEGNTIFNNSSAAVIEGAQAGIRFQGDPDFGLPGLRIFNRGLITGDTTGPVNGGFGILARDGVVGVRNLAEGTIRGTGGTPGLSNGIAIDAAGASADPSVRANLVENAGLIDGDVNFGTGNDVIVNSGRITGDLRFREGDDALVVLPTARFDGSIDMGPGDDRLIFDGEAGTVGDVALLSNGRFFATGVNLIGKTGAGTWRFVGDDIAPAIQLAPGEIEAGLAVFGASLPTLDLTNRVAGTIGTIGSGARIRDLLNEGTLAPGLDAGTSGVGLLRVDGDLTMASTSRYLVDIAADGTSDRVIVGGTATLGGSLLVNGIGYPTGYADSGNYIVLAAAGGVSGRFGTVSDNLPDVDVMALYDDPTLVRLTYVRDGAPPVTPPVEPPVTPPVTPPVEPPVTPPVTPPVVPPVTPPVVPPLTPPTEPPVLPPANPPAQPPANFTRKENAPAALQGAAHASMDFAGTLAERGGRVLSGPSNERKAVAALAYDEADRKGPAMKAAEGVALSTAPHATRFWLGGFGGGLSVQGSDGLAGFDGRTRGITMGADRNFGPASLGMAAGYSRADVEVPDGRATVDSLHVGVYGALRRGVFSLEGALAYSYSAYDFERSVLGATATASPNGQAVSGSLEAAYDIAPALGLGGVQLAPALRLRGVHAERAGFDERGVGLLDLTVADDEIGLLLAGLGVTARSTWQVGGVELTPDISLFYERDLGDGRVTSRSTITPAAIAFDTAVSSGGRDVLSLDLGLGARLGDAWTARLGYESAFASKRESHAARVEFSFRF